MSKLIVTVEPMCKQKDWEGPPTDWGVFEYDGWLEFWLHELKTYGLRVTLHNMLWMFVHRDDKHVETA